MRLKTIFDKINWVAVETCGFCSGFTEMPYWVRANGDMPAQWTSDSGSQFDLDPIVLNRDDLKERALYRCVEMELTLIKVIRGATK